MKAKLMWAGVFFVGYVVALYLGFSVGRETGLNQCAVYIDAEDAVHISEDLSSEDRAELYRSMVTNRWRKKPANSNDIECGQDGALCFGDSFKKESDE